MKIYSWVPAAMPFEVLLRFERVNGRPFRRLHIECSRRSDSWLLLPDLPSFAELGAVLPANSQPAVR